MTIPRNPYVAGNPVGNSPAFIGRAGVLREVLRVLRRPQDNAIVLYGQRRIGKTSILQYLAIRLPEEGPYHPVYYDLQDKAAWPLGRVLLDLARTIAYALDQPDPDLGPDPEAAFRDEWLPALLGSLPEGTAVVLLLDEFDVLADPKREQAAAAFFPYLRGLLATDPGRLQFEFVIGRNVDDLDNIALSVFKGTPARRISLLSREDIVELVRLSEANHTLRWPDDALEQVWEWTHGHPFLTQQLCSHVWERAYEETLLQEEVEEPPTVAPIDVDAAVPAALDASRNTMEWLWDGLPPAERVVASALAEAGANAITSDGLERLLHESGVRVVIRELQNAPELLQDWDLIEPTDGGYRFRVELLRRWIAENKPLRRVQEELDQIEPVAENLYQAAMGLYQGGQLAEAEVLLRQALGLNPNHVRANQLLADILLAQDHPKEARQLLERLYEYQPAAARPRLVQALLAEAQATAIDEGQIALYERVLKLDPAQPEAAARAAAIREVMRRRDLEDRLRELEALEQSGQYQGALTMALNLADEYPVIKDWEPELKRLEQKAHIPELYERALAALDEGDVQTAQTLLVQVVSLEPGYEEATRYLHLAVTGSDMPETQPRSPATTKDRRALTLRIWRQPNWQRFGPWLALLLIAVSWVIFGVAGSSIWANVPGDLDKVALALVGAIGGAINGLILGLALRWAKMLPRGVQVGGLVIGGAIIGTVFWAMAEGLFGSAGAPAGAIAMTAASAVLVLLRVLADRRASTAEEVLAKRPAPGRRLRPWNPLDHLRLLSWLIITPQRLGVHAEALGREDVRKTGRWLVSTLVWLPLLLTTMGLGLSTDVSTESAEALQWTSLGLILAWALTGWFGDRGSRWVVWATRAGGFAVGAWASFAVAIIILDDLYLGSPSTFVAVAIALAVGVALGIAMIVVNGVAAGVAAGVLVGVAIGAAIAPLVVGTILPVAGVVGGVLGFALSFAVSRRGAASLESGQPSWLGLGASIVLLLCYVLLAWFGLFEGYTTFW